MTKSCHKLGKILHESCSCAHIRRSMVPCSYLLFEVESWYDAATGARVHVCAFVAANLSLETLEGVVVPSVWIAFYGDAKWVMAEDDL